MVLHFIKYVALGAALPCTAAVIDKLIRHACGDKGSPYPDEWIAGCCWAIFFALE